ncbi:SDR family NAD(P)-dependent oxidoreductase [uncultured Tateyamaria sp.]|uniref:SDR family NAD(P)-dependent oxidoreductase n=1 Tax=uncultured Tateyamaria sp. TaxID=455651 RepID=UPI002606B061|nr:SDR family NAD(P)-dependent oxidoreductase [uncultured Tateyamaria sp.]
MNKTAFLSRFGPWAMVTGATSGIGREFADQLADMGMNLVLVSRCQDALDGVAASLSKRSGIQTRTIALDLSDPGFLAPLKTAIADIDLGLIVSNAGADHMGALLRIPLPDLQAMQRLNAASHLDMAHGFGTLFMEKRKTAGLIFVSSTASLQATPLLANYAGAKAYVMNLGAALNSELQGTGIHSTVLVPGPTKTPAFTDRTDIDLKTMPMPPMKTRPVVRAALQGVMQNKPIVIPGTLNRVMDWMGRRVLTRGMSAGMWGMLMNKAAPDTLKVKPRV